MINSEKVNKIVLTNFIDITSLYIFKNHILMFFKLMTYYINVSLY
jgi:hypothetical protein